VCMCVCVCVCVCMCTCVVRVDLQASILDYEQQVTDLDDAKAELRLAKHGILH